MSLFERHRFEALLAGLPAVEIVHQWGDASVGKVGGKIFALLSTWDDEDVKIGFKCSDMAFEMLPGLRGVQRARYLARAKWVQVARDSELGEDEIEAYVRNAHTIIVAKLPRKIQVALGLDALKV